MPGGFNRNDTTPSSPGFDVCMASVVPALVTHAAVFELPVSSVHFTFCLIWMLEKRRPGETRVRGAVFKHRPPKSLLYFSSRHELILVISVS